MAEPIPNAAEFDALWDAVFDGAATANQVARLEELVLASADLRRRYVELADQEAALAWGEGELPAPTAPPAVPVRVAEEPAARPVWRRRRFWAAAAAHAAVTACLLFLWATFALQTEQGAGVFVAGEDEPGSSDEPAATWAGSAGAELFGGAAPAVGRAAPTGVEQALRAGWVRLRFAAGATAVLEGPAVFEVAAADRLILKAGRCSVHAPEGAEGFRVDTPDGRVVDLGTRFAVRVPVGDEGDDAGGGGGTEVHVVEGLAELHPAAPDAGRSAGAPDGAAADRLGAGQAGRLTGGALSPAGAVDFDPAAYRGTLPDRVVSYVTRNECDGGGGLGGTTTATGTTTLAGLTVQRAGRVRTYAAADLTPATVTAFAAPPRNLTFAVPGPPACGPSARPAGESFALNAGRLNPGGSPTPLTADPVLTGDGRTPGMALRFDPPVPNGPGPDLVVFDLQSVTDVPAGDAFHLSPVAFRPGLRTATVRRFDLTVGDAAASVVAPFVLPRVPPDAPADAALDPDLPRHVPPLRFTANAVAVDLSDLGYAAGERVAEVFLQDARDDPKFVDPTLVVGLPADRPAASPDTPAPRSDTP